MSEGVVIRLDSALLDKIIREMPDRADKAVRRVAFRVEARAKKNAPVKTGALRSSIYTSTRGTGMLSLAGIVKRVGKKSTAGSFEPLPIPTKAATAYVGPSVEYGIFVELGTSRMAAQPFLTPAVEGVQQSLAGEFASLFGESSMGGAFGEFFE